MNTFKHNFNRNFNADQCILTQKVLRIMTFSIETQGQNPVKFECKDDLYRTQ